MFASLTRAKTVAKEESRHLPPELDGAVIYVGQGLGPNTRGGHPRRDPSHPHPLACYGDGKRIEG